MTEDILNKYAEFAIKSGINVCKGQVVRISSSLEQAPLAKLLMLNAYKNGASKVTIDWHDDDIIKYQYQYESEETLSTMQDWEIKKVKYYSKIKPCYIYIDDDDPRGLVGIDNEKKARVQLSRYNKTKRYSDAMSGKYQWCIIGASSKKWAKMVYPELDENTAVESLWNAIFKASRFDPMGDPISEWKKHNKILADRCYKLNALHIDSLHYYSKKTGTDLIVKLSEVSKFMGGAERVRTPYHTEFNPNIPTEECFTSPDKTGTNGIVYSTKPLSYEGDIIDKFWLKFKDGKVIDCGAEVNEQLLKTMISKDEGSSMLGECALISYDSPINNQNTLFYSTLFDENASCHLALGRGFSDCMTGNLKKDRKKYNLNNSMIHVDFMIGCDDLEIIAITKNGERIDIFKNGNFTECFN